ncbi:uncharacterized protein M421DRAFT_422443 [Didymella exigua CBS 183.55]|uniref:Uncharacterized protein n=1 Tax=Didymella exigua CBS 183.55 TaxID=1150837 RepID=A0A6A5RKB1_9PLEO|nr:uncharacterized protein M421DRAFT_422443 [Didymella exigua CBS 183.55]KAF1926836.1 hypothetical protein M421DRAFT_422443 [Didymella exigua CBS 183.55]
MGSGNPDMALIGELMEEMSRRPPAIAARKLLVEHYICIGWVEAALDNTKELRTLAPGDSDVIGFLSVLEKKPEPPAPDTTTLPPAPKNSKGQPTDDGLVWDVKNGRYKKKPAIAKSTEKKPDVSGPQIGDDLDTARQDLVTGYQNLRIRVGSILTDLLHLQALQKKANILPSRNTAKVQRIVDGQPNTSVQLCTPRTTAHAMRETPEHALVIAVADMEEAVGWHKGLLGQTTDTNTDKLRDAIVKRKAALEVILPDDLKIYCEFALMHMDHEHFGRNYINTETMYGDEVKDIPRSKFYATEDNYAWDMEELVAAIEAGSGVLRNPLSKHMFTPRDVKGIYMHPLAKRLAALAVEQKDMSKGVRPETITRMEKLSSILLEDQSAETLPSRHAVDEFLAYVATLPDLEQNAIERLKCPAKDSHTGQAYDSSIGEAVRDAKGNRVCFHKTGDFIRQAASYLRLQKGVAPDAAGCRVI